MCQIASFYAGAMSEARTSSSPPAWAATGADFAVMSADDPAAMVRHSEECRDRGFRFAADPSQQIARMDGDDLIALIEGADLLFTNDYEKSLLESKTGLSERRRSWHRCNVRVTTLGSDGVEIVGRDMERVHVPVAKERAGSTRPASATGSAPGCSPRASGACPGSGPPRSAACSPHWCWRRSAPRSTRSSRTSSRTPGRVLR